VWRGTYFDHRLGTQCAVRAIPERRSHFDHFFRWRWRPSLGQHRFRRKSGAVLPDWLNYRFSFQWSVAQWLRAGSPKSSSRQSDIVPQERNSKFCNWESPNQRIHENIVSYGFNLVRFNFRVAHGEQQLSGHLEQQRSDSRLDRGVRLRIDSSCLVWTERTNHFLGTMPGVLRGLRALWSFRRYVTVQRNFAIG
jgi:hypothetical protein